MVEPCVGENAQLRIFLIFKKNILKEKLTLEYHKKNSVAKHQINFVSTVYVIMYCNKCCPALPRENNFKVPHLAIFA